MVFGFNARHRKAKKAREANRKKAIAYMAASKAKFTPEGKRARAEGRRMNGKVKPRRKSGPPVLK